MFELFMSFMFVVLIMVISMILMKYNVLSDEESRKFIHIGAANWWLVAIWLLEDSWLFILAPIAFIFLNYLSHHFHLVKAMERSNKTEKNYGTVYYAISLLVVAIISKLVIGDYSLGTVPILVMGYADGLSALVGIRFGKKKLTNNKTIAGTLTMFVVSLIVGFIFIPNILLVLLLALIATLLELVTKNGLDNLTVPISLVMLLSLFELLL